MRRRFVRFLRIAVLTTAVACGVLYLSLASIIGFFVKHVFEWGTGCSVDFDNPQVTLSPLRASIDNLVILAPGETHGARAQRLSTGIEYYSLRNRELRLMPLRIEGANVESIGSDSSLIRILKFVIPDRDEVRQTSWDVSLATLYISPPGPGENFVFGWDQLRFHFSHFSFAGENMDSPPEEDTFLSAISDQLTVTHPVGEFRFPSFRSRFPIRQGLLNIEEAQFGNWTVAAGDSSSEARGFVTGKVLLPQGGLDVHVDMKLPLRSINQLRPTQFVNDMPSNFPGDFSLNAHVLGLYSAAFIRGNVRSADATPDSPQLRGDVEVDMGHDTVAISDAMVRAFPFDLVLGVLKALDPDDFNSMKIPDASVDGLVSLDVSGMVREAKLEAVKGRLRLDRLQLLGESGMTLSSNFVGKGDVLSFDSLQLQHPRAVVTGAAQLGIPERTLQLDLNTPEIQLGPLGGISEISLSAKVPLAALRETKGEIRAGALNLAAGGGAIANTVPIVVQLENQKLSMSPTLITALDRKLTVGGEVGIDKGWNAFVRGNWTLKQLIPTPASLEQFGGEVELNLAVTGAWNDPQFRGPLKLRGGDASIRLDQTFVGIDGLEVDADFDGRDLQIGAIRGRIGTGVVSGSGRIAQVLADEREGSISMRLRDVVIEPLADLVLEGEGDLLLRLEQQSRPTLGGKVFLHSAVYREKFDLKRLLEIIRKPTPQTAALRATTSYAVGTPGGLDLDLEVAAENGLVVETDLFQAELRGSLRLEGPAEAVKANGRVEVIEGSFGLQSNRFEIVHGALTFSPSEKLLNPRIDMVSETTVNSGPRGKQHLVQLAVSGQLASPRVTLTSDTGLAESDILSLLTVGASIEGVSLLGGGRRVAKLSYAELLSSKQELTFAERLSGLTGFSDLRIEEVTTLEANESVPTISVRRNLFEGAEAVLQTELSERQSMEARGTYELTPTINFLVGWKNRSARDPESTRGSLDIGFLYKQTYPGVDIFAPELFSLE